MRPEVLGKCVVVLMPSPLCIFLFILTASWALSKDFVAMPGPSSNKSQSYGSE
mgnify:CR=1 FL=1